MTAITCAGCKHGYTETALFCPNCGRPKARDAVVDALVGKVLGERFQVQAAIGQGASGTIYRAEHITLRRKVAIKVLHAELSRDDLAVERFRREATTVAEIDNEHIVEIHDFGRTFDGRLYLAMELLEGETLDGVIAREKQLSIERAADILIQLGEALMEAHAIGYVHRDMRPRNVYLAVRRGKANFVKLLDFGLAKLVETDASAASTSLGMTFGDPRYMSPEQARGDRIDLRADIYQLGCVAYEMLTGAPPFSGNRVFDILTKQVTEAPAPLPTRRPGVPLWMEAAVAKMLAKDPANRFATTTRMVEALRRGLETGEVMEDQIARRRESIPPPSVSRVMQRMGMQPTDSPPQAELLLPRADSKPELEVKPDPKPELKPEPKIVEPMPVAKAVAVEPKVEPKVALQPAAESDEDDAEPEVPKRRRTGTPRVMSKLPADSTQLPVSGSIDAPVARKRPTTDSSVDEANISQVWYDEGEEETPAARRRKPSPSTTDVFDEHEPTRQGKRWPMMLAALGVCGILGVTIALAMRSPKETKTDKTDQPIAAGSAAQPVAGPTATIDAAPSTIIAPDPTVPAVAVVAPKVVPGVRPPRPDTARPDPIKPVKKQPGDNSLEFFPRSGSNVATQPIVTPPIVTPPIVIPPKKDPGITDGPQDPYNTGGTSDGPGDATPEKKAEFYANVGQQQLGGNDTTGAAGSFKKALELDPKNVVATIGMGEIALRQGLFGDAIAHLSRASRLSPRNAKVFTLLGEAYLNSGNNKSAADNFKKALQIDPDNVRARDGYNEASSKVPPPKDD